MNSSRGVHRSGARGMLGALDANGFATFTADNGARFTVHSSEFCADSAPADTARAMFAQWAGWPKGALSIAVRADTLGRKSLVVRGMAQRAAHVPDDIQ